MKNSQIFLKKKLELNKLKLKLIQLMLKMDFRKLDRRNLASLSCVFWSDCLSSAGFIGFLGGS